MRLIAVFNNSHARNTCSGEFLLISLPYCSGNKKKTKNLQNVSNINEPCAEVEDVEGSEQVKSTKKKRPAERPSRADAQVSKPELLVLKIVSSFFENFENYFVHVNSSLT